MLKAEIPRSARKLLDYLIKTRPDIDGLYYAKEYIPYSCGLGELAGMRALSFLLAGGYVSEPERGKIFLELRGSEYKELMRLELAMVWKERIIGFVSGALLTGLGWYLSVIATALVS